MFRIAMLLSGCGNMDGSEIHESVAAIIAIDQKGWDIVYAAPDISQKRTVSHMSGKNIAARNALEESARIARGAITALSEELLDSIDAVVIPGGMGAALTLCDFALHGESCQAHPEVEAFIRSAHRRGIPIGAMCIAPALVARCIPGVTVTIGTDKSTAEKIRGLGCEHVDCSPEESYTDMKNRVVSTPAYMAAEGPAQVLKGAESMIDALEKLISL
ncbi:MAG: isoprenoid biosynthesis glyoxalase ElbB [Candidatus Fermentibacteria bacterium]|nr:isoprenoid biosynthesis glyoxalase ElbB [Candidatus Fermentibacteria bacterium]